MANPWHQPDAAPAQAGTAIPRVLEGVRNIPPPRDVPAFVLDITAAEEVPSKRPRLGRQLLSKASEDKDIVAAALDIAERLTEEEARSPSPGIQDPAVEDLAALEAALLEGFAATGFEVAESPRNPQRPKKPGSDKSEVIRVVERWCNLDDVDKVLTGVRQFAFDNRTTPKTILYYVNFWGTEWNRRVAGHEAEFVRKGAKQPAPRKRLGEVYATYSRLYPGSIDRAHFIAYVKAEGVEVKGLRALVRTLPHTTHAVDGASTSNIATPAPLMARQTHSFEPSAQLAVRMDGDVRRDAWRTPSMTLKQAKEAYWHQHDGHLERESFIEFAERMGVTSHRGIGQILARASTAGRRRAPAGKLQNDPAVVIDAAAEWRALPYAKKLSYRMGPFAAFKGTTGIALRYYVDFEGNWNMPVPGHEEEYRPRVKGPPRATPELREAVYAYRQSTPGEIVPDDLIAYLESRSITRFEGLQAALRGYRIARTSLMTTAASGVSSSAEAGPASVAPWTGEEFLSLFSEEDLKAIDAALVTLAADSGEVAGNP